MRVHQLDDGFAGFSSGSDLTLNFFPASFSADGVEVLVGPYGDEQRFAQLIRDHPSWSQWRDVDDAARVFVWNMSPSLSFPDRRFRPATVRLSENSPLFCRIMLGGIERHLCDLGFAKVDRDSFVKWEAGNLCANLNVPGFAPDPRVGVSPRITLQSFVTRFRGDGPITGLIVDVDYAVRMDVPLDVLVRASFDPRGKYVKLLPGAGGPDVYRDVLIGRVESVDGADVVLDDLRDPDLRRVPAAWCTLQAGWDALDDYLHLVTGERFADLKSRIRAKFVHAISPKERLRLIEGFARTKLLGPDGTLLSIGAGLTVAFGPAVRPREHSEHFPATELQNPSYSFDPESVKTDIVPDAGLKRWGPYSRARLSGQRLRILVLAPQRYKGQVEQFVQQFQQGIRGYTSTFNGFQRKYRLTGATFTERYFPVTTGPPGDAYYNAVVQALDESTDYDLCFVVIREDFRLLHTRANPYYVCKALLLSFGTTVQDMPIEKVRMPEANLQWILNTLSLATYAKAGGTPFVLKARQVEHHELIFGIGRSIEREPGSRLGAIEQIIGFTTVFRSDGDYLLNACTPYTDFANYERRLEEVILRSVAEVAASEGIADGEEIRLIFHVYKRTGRREVHAIENAIAKLTRYRLDYALLHVNDSHHFKLFDRRNQGSPDRFGKPDAATALTPPRRMVIELGPRERLINFIGPKQYRRRGTPAPVRVTLDRSSTFTDLVYLTQQVYEFSFLSWRSFNPGIQPVTILYSELMADLNSHLRQVAPWNQDLVRTKLKRKLWFI